MVLRKSFATFVFLLFASLVFGQTNAQLRQAKKDIYYGDKQLLDKEIPNYRNALKRYRNAYKYKKDDEELIFKLAVCYLNTLDKTKAIPLLEKLEKNYPDYSEEIPVMLARAYHLDMQFDKAIKYYKEYRNSLDKDQLQEKEVKRVTANIIQKAKRMTTSDEIDILNLRGIIKKRLKECRMGKRLVRDSIDVNIQNIGGNINSSYSDYAPVISADESVMYFTTRREGTLGEKIEPLDGLFLEDIYKSERQNDKWAKAVNIGEPVNSAENHESAIGLSPDGQKLFVYRGDGQIYYSDKKGEEWTDLEAFDEPVNTDEYFEYSASISGDLQTMYFVSDREGGVGGQDIYKAVKNKDGDWTDVTNLGPVVNTKYNEKAVFLHPNGNELYFSSRGHTSMGGYDIFKSTKTDTGWTDPKNIGYPINTPDEDVYFVLSADGKTGYYSTVKKSGYGKNDIYKIRMPREKKMAKIEKKDVKKEEDTSTMMLGSAQPTNPLTILKGKITDATTDEPLKAEVKVVNNENKKTISELESNKVTGKYLVTLPSGKNYGISIEKKGYVFHSENFDIPKSQGYQEVVKDIALQPAKAGSKIVLNNIFFDFNKASLRKESKPELNRLVKFLKKNNTLKAQISGHTDSKGSAAYNKKLSHRRAESVVDYLVKQGITRSRLKAKGYGESKPVAPNTLPDGSDNPEGRQLNRRTELEILDKQGEVVTKSKTREEVEQNVVPISQAEEMQKGVIFTVQIAATKSSLPSDYFRTFDKIYKYSANGMNKYMVGLFGSFKSAKKHRDKVKSYGIDGAFIVAFKDGKKISLEKARATVKK